MGSFYRIGFSLVATLAAYWIYALVAVPMIEPTVDAAGQGAGSSRDSESVRLAYARRRQALVGLFAEGSWPLTSAKILASDQVKLIFQDYRNLGNGQVEIYPCAVIYTPDGPPETLAERTRSSLILEAPDGAMLDFDEPFDLSHVKIGRLKAGRLAGQVTIRSHGKEPGPEDDLSVITRDVELTDTCVQTPHKVTFRMGPNYGRGEHLIVKLLAGEEGSEAGRHGPNVVGMESFEIRRLDQLHLEFDDSQVESGDRQPGPGKKTKAGSKVAIEVACRGPFRFDPIRQSITFEDRVSVHRLQPDGPSDQLNCELLSIHLARPRSAADDLSTQKPGSSSSRRPAMLDLRPSRIEAEGSPVVIFAPSEEVQGQGDRLDYNLQSGDIVLDGPHEVFLQQGKSEIHAQSLKYKPGEKGSIGQIEAAGPGWLRGQMDGKIADQLSARWGKQLLVQPVDRQQVVSLTGQTQLSYGGFGRLTAEKIEFWLNESEPNATDKDGKPSLKPDRMRAQQQVNFDSPQLSARVRQLEIWFEQDASYQPGGEQVAYGGGSVGGQLVSMPGQQGDSLQPIRRPAGGQALIGNVGHSTDTAPKQHFEISGDLLRSRVLMRGVKTDLTELMIEGDVRLKETRTAKPDERPLAINGERIHVVDADKPHAAVTVLGSPAHFEGRGMALNGSNINLNRGTNRLWVDGPGWIDLPLDRDFEGRTLPKPDTLSVHWQERMAFDGKTAGFEGTIVASSRNQNIETDSLEVSLKRAIRFDKPPQGGSEAVEVEEIRCHGEVYLESRSFDEKGQSSLDRLEVANLTINRGSGAIRADGPGWMTTVRRGSGGMMVLPGANGAAAGPPAEKKNDDENKLSHLNVSFEGPIEGNLHAREVSFNDQVKTVYSPVDSWQAAQRIDESHTPDPRSVQMTCNQLTVAQMPTPDRERWVVELAALGAVAVEGQTADGQRFFARAARMTYTEMKDLLIMEGDGRTDAELYYQQYLGSPFSKAAANRILIYALEQARRLLAAS